MRRGLDWMLVLGIRLWRGIWWVEIRSEAIGVSVSRAMTRTREISEELVYKSFWINGKRSGFEMFKRNEADVT